MLLLAGAALFVVHSSNPSRSINQSSALLSTQNGIVNPLDQLSSADIAVSVARMTNLPEATSAANHADTVNALLSVSPADQTIVAKPQVVATLFKSNKDIQKYITKAGDTVSKLAEKFGVTSDSIRSSNGLTGDQLAAGQTLYIPPFNGIVYLVQQGDTPASLAKKFSASKDQIVAFNDAEINGLKPGVRIVIPNGIISAGPTFAFFGPSNFAPAFGANGYDFGWCTWYVANRRNELGRPVPNNLGDAASWFFLAQRAGLPTGSSPRVGAVAVNLGGDHVSVVEKVNSDGSFWVSEMNAGGQVSITNPARTGGWGVRDYKLYGSAAGIGFIY